MDTFTWYHNANPSGTVKFRTLSARFGDGYEQTAPDGINNKLESWPLTFEGTSASITPIKTFLESKLGTRSFLWTPPLGTQGMYKCKTLSVVPKGGDNYEISATFEQSFQP